MLCLRPITEEANGRRSDILRLDNILDRVRIFVVYLALDTAVSTITFFIEYLSSGLIEVFENSALLRIEAV